MSDAIKELTQLREFLVQRGTVWAIEQIDKRLAEMEKTALDACPFCRAGRNGSNSSLLSTIKEGRQWKVYCHNCGASGPASDSCGEEDEKEREQARKAWNKAPRQL